MSKVEEKITKYGTKAWWAVSANQFSREGVVDDFKEIKAEQEELQKKVDKMAYNQAKKIIEKETGVVIPHNFAEVWEARGQIAALMNTLSFELDKRDDDRSYEQFIWDSLEQSKPVELVPFVAEWADICTEHKALPADYFSSFISNTIHRTIVIPMEIRDWFESRENQELFLLAMKNGYTVKQEQLYYVELPLDKTVNGFGRLAIDCKSGKQQIVHTKIDLMPNLKTKFTESEIKAIDERYMAFAVKVEEEKQ